MKIKKQLHRELDSENLDDVREIEKMLREQSMSKTNWLKNNIMAKQIEIPDFEDILSTRQTWIGLTA